MSEEEEVPLPQTCIAHTDGAARGNPGPAGAGAVLQVGREKKLLHRYLGETTNNQAEYSALLLALEEARNLGVAHFVGYADSELMVKQINGEYKVKNAGLKPLFAEVQQLLGDFESFRIEHVRREKNTEADRLANLAIDEQKEKEKGSG